MSQVARRLEDVEDGPSVVTIGVFDGVHRGHQQIIDRAVGVAGQHDVRAVVVTFDPHPAAVVRPDAAPALLQLVDQRVEALLRVGVDEVLVLPFTDELAALSPRAFVQRVLAGPLGAQAVVVGNNFRFGQGASGDVDTLAELGAVHGFDTMGVPLLDRGGEVLSSTAVRAALRDGEVARASEALGRPWRYQGEVVRGDGRGRTIGVPTANVVADDRLVRPGGGVYAARAQRGTDQWDAVVNVGTRPTFGGTTTTVEAHLLDAAEDLDLYTQQLSLDLVARLRGEQRFDGVEALVAQIHADVVDARELL